MIATLRPDAAVADTVSLPPRELVFARHETFPPRYGWLKKGFEAVAADPAVFGQPEAASILGVGKNMARAIRYWCHATGLVEEASIRSDATALLRPTAFGASLIGPQGYDPYLEDLGTLWLLHWSLLRPGGRATAWRYVFFESASSEFTVEELSAGIERMLQRRYPKYSVANSSLRKDCACIVQMYAGTSERFENSEESIRSPFVQLELIERGLGSRRFAFRVGGKPGLTPTLIAYCCIDFMEQNGLQGSVPFDMLLRHEGSPGLALRLSESALYSALEHVSTESFGCNLSDTAGIVQFSVRDRIEKLKKALLSAHYT